MQKRIISVERIFESEDDGQKSQEDIKSQIIGDHEDAQFKQVDNGDNVVITLPSGYRYEISSKALLFYQHIFDDNMEKYVAYEKYVPVIDRLVGIEGNASQIEIKLEKLKDIKNNFSLIEDEIDLNSIQYRIVNSEELDEQTTKKLYNAYSTGKVSELSPEELSVLNKYMNDYLLYYKYLIGVFKIYE